MIENGFGITFAASLLAGIITTTGILSMRRFERWAREQTTYFACFAAGILIAVSFLHLVPTSFDMNPQAPIYLFSGYMAIHLLNRFLTVYVCDKPKTASYAFGLVPLIGIGFHSLIDGVIFSISFNVSVFTGTMAALGMVLHEFPEGVLTYALLIRSGFSRQKGFLLSFFAAAATTPIGTALSYPLISNVDPQVLGAMLALSSGALIYVGATHLLPRAENEPRRYSLLAFLAGIVIALTIVFSSG